MTSTSIRMHSFLPFSRANGPGVRAVLWVQGCTLGCPGCFNPETHNETAGKDVDLNSLFDQILAIADKIEGVTISGGEPLQQRAPLEQLLSRIRSHTSLSSIVMSGYTWAEIQRMPTPTTFLALVDVLIAGRFDSHQVHASGMRGSANKTVHFLSSRYSEVDLASVASSEIVLGTDGTIIVSGIDPVRL